MYGGGISLALQEHSVACSSDATPENLAQAHPRRAGQVRLRIARHELRDARVACRDLLLGSSKAVNAVFLALRPFAIDQKIVIVISLAPCACEAQTRTGIVIKNSNSRFRQFLIVLFHQLDVGWKSYELCGFEGGIEFFNQMSLLAPRNRSVGAHGIDFFLKCRPWVRKRLRLRIDWCRWTAAPRAFQGIRPPRCWLQASGCAFSISCAIKASAVAGPLRAALDSARERKWDGLSTDRPSSCLRLGLALCDDVREESTIRMGQPLMRLPELPEAIPPESTVC